MVRAVLRQAGLTRVPEARLIVLHSIYVLTMKTNITLKLDADLVREVRIMAASEGTSISALLAARLEKNGARA